MLYRPLGLAVLGQPAGTMGRGAGLGSWISSVVRGSLWAEAPKHAVSRASPVMAVFTHTVLQFLTLDITNPCVIFLLAKSSL